MNKRKYPRRRYQKRKRYGRGLLGQDKWSRYFTKQKGGSLWTIFGTPYALADILARQLSKQ